MQAEESKKFSIDMDDFIPKIIDCMVKGLYGEAYKERIEEKLNSVHFIFTGSNRHVVETLKEFEEKGIINDAQEKIKIFEKVDYDEQCELEKAEKEYFTLLNKMAEQIYNYCQENNYKHSAFSSTEKIVDIFLYGTLDVSMMSYIASAMGRKDLAVAVRSGNDEAKKEIEKTDLWNMLCRGKEENERVHNIKQKIRDKYKLLTNSSIEFVKSQNLFEEDKVLAKFEEDDMTAGIAIATINHNAEWFNCVLMQVHNLKDHVIIHELIHILETVFGKIDLENEFYKYYIGFSQTKSFYNKGENEQFENKEEARTYAIFTALNEAITDWFATIILDYMRANNLEIFNNEKYSSQYSQCFPYCNDIFQLMKEDLILYRTEGRSKEFFELLGKDKMREFAEIVNYFMNRVGLKPEDQIKEINKAFGTNYESMQEIVENLEKFGETNNEFIGNLRKKEELKLHYLSVKNQLNEESLSGNVEDVVDV